MNEKQVFVNKEHKDNVFRILYRNDKTRQIELYNAVSGKNYTEDADLEVVTLKHAIYMGMKNDLAFIVSDDLHLYEGQSTINPNMPLRFLHYISKEYEGLVEGRKLYGSTPVKLQTPYFTVFYNGTKKYPERLILKLSDLYKMSEMDADSTAEIAEATGIPFIDFAGNNMEHTSDTVVKIDKDTELYSDSGKAPSEISRILQQESPLLELKVLVININPGNNKDFLDQCPTLREYMEYVERVRRYCSDMDLKDAVQRAVDECIKDGILADFLRMNKAEVMAMSIFEYDEKEVLDYIREEERTIGEKKEARRYGRLILHLTNEGKSDLIVKIATDDALRESLYQEYQL